MKSGRIKLALMGIVALAALSAALMLLWNWLLPGIFGLTAITFWQALGLFVLSRLLFGHFGFGRNKIMHHEQRSRLHEKWMKMTPEQRKEFIRKRRKFGFGHPFGMAHFDLEEHDKPTGEKE